MTTFLILILFFVFMFFVTKDKTTLTDVKNSIKKNGLIIICNRDLKDITNEVDESKKNIKFFI